MKLVPVIGNLLNLYHNQKKLHSFLLTRVKQKSFTVIYRLVYISKTMDKVESMSYSDRTAKILTMNHVTSYGQVLSLIANSDGEPVAFNLMRKSICF